jgi:hypothetical protein
MLLILTCQRNPVLMYDPEFKWMNCNENRDRRVRLTTDRFIIHVSDDNVFKKSDCFLIQLHGLFHLEDIDVDGSVILHLILQK